jgi:hypothetical protein
MFKGRVAYADARIQNGWRVTWPHAPDGVVIDFERQPGPRRRFSAGRPTSNPRQHYCRVFDLGAGWPENG